MTGWGRLRAATFALFAIAASAVVPRVVAAQDVTCDPGDVEVRALEFRGNRAVSDDELATRVTTTASSRIPFGQKRCLDRAGFPEDRLALEAYYHRRGFYYASVDTTVQPDGRGKVKVIFTIDEGPATILRRYAVTGLSGLRDSAAIMNARRLRVGQPFDIDLFSADMDTIVGRLRNAGYYRAELLHEYNRDSLTASATITVLPGRRARFGTPVFDVTPVPGRTQQLDTSVVRRVMGIAPGTWYSDRAVVEAQRNLFGLGIYRHIEVSPPDSLQPAGDSTVVLLVQLAEDYMRQLDSEFGWATLDCGRVRLQYTDRNLMGTARRMDVTGQLSKIGYGAPLATTATKDFCKLYNHSPLKDDFYSDTLQYYAGVSLRQPRLLGFRWTPTLSLYSERRGEYRAYLRRTYVGGDFSAVRDVALRTPLRLGYTMEYGFTQAPDAALCALFNRCDPESRKTLTEEATLGVASLAISRLRTDNIITPTHGYAARAEARSSASSLLGTSPNLYFNKGTADAIWYRPLGTSVLAVRLRGGVVVGRARLTAQDPGFVPPQERLYAGGATSVRGFQQNELGDVVYIAGQRGREVIPSGVSPTGDTLYRMQINPDSVVNVIRTVPLGGNSLTVLNFDLRIPDPFFFPDVLQYSLFLDGGQVWRRTGVSGLGFQSLKWTPGIGVRALTPVGPVQMNIGYNPYDYPDAALYYNPNVSTLYCVTPGNTVDLVRDSTRTLRPVDPNAECAPFHRGARRRYQRLTFTFSIGPEF